MARPDLSLPIPAHFCNIAVQAAAAEVLALIQSRPTSPWPHEIEAILSKAIAPQPLASSVASSPPPRLAQYIRATISRLHEGWDVLEHLVKGPEFHVAEADVEALTDELRALEEQLFPPSSCGDLVLLAEIARCGAGVVNGRMVELDEDDAFLRRAARLIEAVMQFDGAFAVATKTGTVAVADCHDSASTRCATSNPCERRNRPIPERFARRRARCCMLDKGSCTSMTITGAG